MTIFSKFFIFYFQIFFSAGKSVMAMMHDETEDLLEQAAESGNVLLIISRRLEGNERSSRESSPTTSTSETLANVSFIQTDIEQKRSPYSSLEHNSGSCRLITAEIMKDFNGLGFIIEGGYSPLGDRPITIKRIFRGLFILKFEIIFTF